MLFTNPIKSNKQYRRAYQKGGKCACDAVCVYYVKNKTPYSGLGITVSKKTGNAVIRNRIKRIIRAAYRLSESELPIGYDFIVVAKEAAKDKKSTDLEAFFKKRLAPKIRREENQNGKKKK